jgi:hypothetical protein
LPEVDPEAIAAHQRRRDVDVLIAVRTCPVTDCHPRRRLSSLSLKAQILHCLVGDFCPLVVGQSTIGGREG